MSTELLMRALTCASTCLVAICACAAPVLTLKTDSDFVRCGEKATYVITVAEDGKLVTSGEVAVVLDNFGTKIVRRERIDLSNANPFTVEGALDEPGFLRLTATLKGAKKLIGSVGFDIERIRPGFARPTDFESFWHTAAEQLEKTVPLDPQMTLMEGVTTAGCAAYRISFATGHGKRVYGFLTVPKDKSKGPFPVFVNVPGAGPGVFVPRGRQNTIHLQMNVHPYASAATEAEMKKLYEAQNKTLCAKYPVDDNRYCVTGLAESREAFFYYDIILGINRAVDWVASRPDVDKKRFVYLGSSQGGAFGHFLCALNSHFTRAVFNVPAMCDMGGYRLGRQSGWPLLVEHQKPENRETVAARAPYFDVANFAPMIRIPVMYSIGLADTTCAPPSSVSAYNSLGTTDKRIVFTQCVGHQVPADVMKKGELFAFGK